MTTPQSPRWVITQVDNPTGLDVWCSDSESVENVERGGSNISYRLIVQTQGFLDITGIDPNTLGLDMPIIIFDFNNDRMARQAADEAFTVTLSIPGDGTFTVVIIAPSGDGSSIILSGKFKPFPSVIAEDAAYIHDKIDQKHVPYPDVPDAPGKTDEEIRKLGQRLFPWSPHSYELAMCVYDWTTASFARMVFMKVFQYTAMAETPLPLDLPSIALMIWESKWDSYIPQNADYMSSFLMQPANAQDEVDVQLKQVHDELQRFSDVENRLLAAAIAALPRTTILARPYLFSGQVDIYQMGMSRFGIGMLEYPGNAGPVTSALEVEFAAAVATFFQLDSVITTKMVWAFTDSEADAMHYSNGILLIVEPHDPADVDSILWDTSAYVTGLSNDPEKTEYLFPPGSMFRVLAVEQGDNVQVIRLQVVSPVSAARLEGPQLLAALEGAVGQKDVQVQSFRTTVLAGEMTLGAEANRGVAHIVKGSLPGLDHVPKGVPPKTDHILAGRMNGRWCRCVEKHGIRK
ncbi:hypothetical protein GSI_03073 [Ganoderma sinense ZZ0214-1]|uniref:Uncharacterized protein n=1 Tax=Ganoderma sinense ZZ0214-1 TaxID=1077348 RepID=A0A2G8SL55_9APHY|nr:hypothetical protein GSI_03073 [Ganoderma sinense ZZ0214-1]